MKKRSWAVPLCALAWLTCEVAIAAPANNDLASATTVTALPFRDSQPIKGATKQSGEPSPSCIGAAATLWYEIKLPTATDVAITTTGSTYDTALGLYTATSRTLSKLVALDCVNDLGTAKLSALAFSAQANKRYFVQVIRAQGSDGTLKLRITTGTQIYQPETKMFVGAADISVAARIVIAADSEQVEVIGRERLLGCFGGCYPLLDVGQEIDQRVGTSPPRFRACASIFFGLVAPCAPA